MRMTMLLVTPEQLSAIGVSLAGQKNYSRDYLQPATWKQNLNIYREHDSTSVYKMTILWQQPLTKV